MIKKEMIAMLLAGGQGSRLGVLTANVAKPAVAFGGKYRIIDFPLSNCINSGVDTVGVLTQYQPLRLNTHIGIGIPWDLDRNEGGVTVLPPYEKSTSSEWYTGTANAIFQNMDYMEQYNPDYVLILSGDHIYKMDYEVMLDFHKANKADVTIACMPVPIEEASRFGIMVTDDIGRITEFEEKPEHPSSNPATYTGLFDLIRDVFAQTPDAKMRGYTNGRFSFNVKGGRCEACRGDGILKIEMHFLPDIYVPCEVCGGKRYNRETLEVKYKGKTIADVLDMTVEEALKFFAPLPKLARKLQTLYDVGLGYIRLGQSSTTLSGGEAQRVKLATELARRDTGRTLYVLDEPTTGLHTDDVKRLIAILQRLCDSGSTVVVIEHNLDVIKTADYIIDLGPEGGDMGGTIVCTGTPEQVAQNKKSYTGIYLKPMLEKGIRE